MAVTAFPRLDVQALRIDDLRLLYAMVHKIRVSPVKLLVAYWQSVFSRDGSIKFTSLITRIADTINLLSGAHQFLYIAKARGLITEEYFIQAHMLKRGPRCSLRMIYHVHIAKVLLACERLQLYRVCQLTFDLDG